MHSYERRDDEGQALSRDVVSGPSRDRGQELAGMSSLKFVWEWRVRKVGDELLPC